MRIAFLLILALASSINASEDPTVKTYGGPGSDRGVHMIQASDGNLIIVGNTTVDSASPNLDVYLLKLNLSGDTVWTRTYGGTNDDNGWSVKETPDSGFIITGFTESYGAVQNDILLLKTDKHGNELWHKTYGGDGDDIAWSVQITNDHNYVLAAQTNSIGAGDLDAYLLLINDTGAVLWAKTYGGEKVDRVFYVDLAVDGSILTAGITYSFGAGDRDAYLIKTDPDGTMQWQRTYGGPGYENAHSVIVNDNNQIVLVGYGHHWSGSAHHDAFISLIDMSGDEIWTKSYGGERDDRAMTAFQTNDGGYILTGYTGSYSVGPWDVYTVKTDALGDTLWTNVYTTAGAETGYDVIQTTDGAYFITGQSFGSHSRDGDLLLLRLEDQ